MGEGPTQPATCNAKWQVCTQTCSPALLSRGMGEVGKQIQKTRNLTNCARTQTQGAVQVDSTQTRDCL